MRHSSEFFMLCKVSPRVLIIDRPTQKINRVQLDKVRIQAFSLHPGIGTPRTTVLYVMRAFFRFIGLFGKP